jgi:hypothetical protein
MENTYHEAIYELVSSEADAATKKRHLKCLNAQIVRLNATYNDQLILDGAGDEGMEDENPSIFQLIRTRRRQRMRHINTVCDPIGDIHTETAEIMQTFTEHLRSSFVPIPIQFGSHIVLHRYATANTSQ